MQSAEIIKSQHPLDADMVAKKQQRDQEIKDIFSGKSDRMIIVIGPCSADNEEALCDYVERLSKVQKKTADKLLLIPRIYTNKPRTMGEGYKGILHQPDPEKEPDMGAGLIALRKIHLEALRISDGLFSADEMLYPENYVYLDDVLSYVAVGARSVENQYHRLVASAIDTPVGMKNPTSGDFSVMLNAIYAAQQEHVFAYQGYEVKTLGNPFAHAVLRGYVNKNGRSLPNYHYEDLNLICSMYAKRNLQNPAVIVDTNHANSNKQFKEQVRIVKEVLHSRKLSGDIRNLIKGFMIESYIVEGSQDITEHTYGKSITDACLGWEDTEELLYYIADKVHAE